MSVGQLTVYVDPGRIRTTTAEVQTEANRFEEQNNKQQTERKKSVTLKAPGNFRKIQTKRLTDRAFDVELFRRKQTHVHLLILVK